MSQPDGEDDIAHLRVVANRLTVAFNVWAVAVGGSAGLVIWMMSHVVSEVSAFQKQFTAYVEAMEHRVTTLEEHDRLSDSERAKAAAEIQALEDRMNGRSYVPAPKR